MSVFYRFTEQCKQWRLPGSPSVSILFVGAARRSAFRRFQYTIWPRPKRSNRLTRVKCLLLLLNDQSKFKYRSIEIQIFFFIYISFFHSLLFSFFVLMKKKVYAQFYCLSELSSFIALFIQKYHDVASDSLLAGSTDHVVVGYIPDAVPSESVTYVQGK